METWVIKYTGDGKFFSGIDNDGETFIVSKTPRGAAEFVDREAAIQVCRELNYASTEKWVVEPSGLEV